MDVLANLVPAAPDEAFQIVELGCGGGELASLLLDRFPQAQYLGLDGSPTMLRAAGERLATWAGCVELRPFWQAALSPWHWRSPVLLVLLLFALPYSLGWLRLRRGGHTRLASVPRLAAYIAGLATVALALLSPLDTYEVLLFSVHMVQHELLMLVAAPLLLLGSPLAVTLWSAPAPVRQALGGLLLRRSPLRRLFDRLTWPPAAWLIATAAVWLWSAC